MNQLCNLFKEAGTNASILQLGYNGNQAAGTVLLEAALAIYLLVHQQRFNLADPVVIRYTLCEIICRKYANDEESELLLFKGNDHNDEVRLRAPHIRFDTYDDYDNEATTLTTKMIIDKNGNVGIGTTNPASKLHVLQQNSTADDILTIQADEVLLIIILEYL